MQQKEMTQAELDFNAIFGTIFCLSTMIDYLQLTQGIMGERNAKYVQNKARDAETSCTTLQANLERELYKRLTPEEKAICEKNMDELRQLLTDMFYLNEKGQHRVKNLIAKIKREEAEHETAA